MGSRELTLEGMGRTIGLHGMRGGARRHKAVQMGQW